METIKRIVRDLSGVVEILRENASPIERYSMYREVKAIAAALVLNAEYEMDEAGREDPAGVAILRKAQCYHPHC
ncbi:hypothetical protein HY623_02870 [Candidatus Uhrbacteria bacterium]|nr:hypothetical protein [Candidatus Uhrbacteria bacterium]